MFREINFPKTNVSRLQRLNQAPTWTLPSKVIGTIQQPIMTLKSTLLVNMHMFVSSLIRSPQAPSSHSLLMTFELWPPEWHLVMSRRTACMQIGDCYANDHHLCLRWWNSPTGGVLPKDIYTDFCLSISLGLISHLDFLSTGWSIRLYLSVNKDTPANIHAVHSQRCTRATSVMPKNMNLVANGGGSHGNSQQRLMPTVCLCISLMCLHREQVVCIEGRRRREENWACLIRGWT